MSEKWKPVTGYVGYYEVSNQGRVASVASGLPYRTRRVILTQTPRNQYGHLAVNLSRHGKVTSHYVHRLVALEWCPRGPGLDYVLHGPEGETVNTAENLRWGTPLQNAADRAEFGAPYPPQREMCGAGLHEMTEENTYRPPKRPNDRHCKACQRKRVRDYRERKSAKV